MTTILCVVTVDSDFWSDEVEEVAEGWSETFNAPEFRERLSGLADYTYIGSSFTIGSSDVDNNRHFGQCMELQVKGDINNAKDFFYNGIMCLPGVTGGTLISIT